MKVNITVNEKNATPAVIKALDSIRRAGGGELHFETGEYHFYKEGTEKAFFAISNNSACDKHMAFPIIGMENVTVDGHGSVFVFHEIVFPFMVSRSKNVTIRNMILDTAMSPLVNFKLHGFSDDGFYMDIDREQSPFFVENGSINFNRESGVWYGKDHLLSLHAIGRHQVQYLATGESTVCINSLPAPVMKCDVTETRTGIYAKYRADSPRRCTFGEETLSAIIDGGRNVDAICLDRSEEIDLQNITVARAIGMGVIGQLSTNIRIDGFCTDTSYHGGHQTLTADSLHFVNCDGMLEIKNCRITDTMDDAINVHGMYTVVSEESEGVLFAKIMHREQYHFNPYREGDRLLIIDNATLEVKAEFTVTDAFFKENSPTDLVLMGQFTYGKENVRTGYLIENPDRMPSLHLHHNRFDRFPHNRISGAGEIIIEENHFSNCHAALLSLDLARYWYESGRIKHLVYRNNRMSNCDITGRGAFITIGVDGIPDSEAPKIHEKIEITGNHFTDISSKAVKAGGVKELIIEDNTFDRDATELIQIS